MMLRMITPVAAAMAVLIGGSVVAAQGPSDPGAPHGMSRAAGMPLRDGALAPGMLTIRVVRQTFSNNLPDQAVRVEQGGGVVTTVRTGPDGRAQVAHLPIGLTVRVSAIVEGERLSSEEFVMPPESGIRVLLIAGGGDATASGVFGDASAPGVTRATPDAAMASVPAAPSSADSTLIVIRVVLAGATLAALVVVIGRLRQPHPPGGRRRARVEE